MGFTVVHKNGTKGADYETYSRILRQKGLDLARVPRVLDPGGRRWLYAWESQGLASEFAQDLARRTGDKGWQVVPVEGPVSEGPLGPLEIQFAARSGGLLFALPPISQAIIRSLFPKAEPAPSVFVGAESAAEVERGWENRLPRLAEQAVRLLTGLSDEQLDWLGYRVADPDAETELLFVPPRESRQR